MEFSVKTLHELEDNFQHFSDEVSESLKCTSLAKVTREMLSSRNVTKDNLIEFVLKMRDLIKTSRSVLRSASEHIDEQKSDLTITKTKLIDVQETLVKNYDKKLDVVQETVKSEMMTFSDVVKKNCSGENFTPAKLKKVVKSVFDDDERPRNIMIFGADEDISCKGEKLSDRDVVNDVFSSLKCVRPEPEIENCRRVGIRKSNGVGRPIKVTLQNPEVVYQVLKNSRDLKSILIPGYSFRFNKLYLSPDRSVEERKIRQKLVAEMKDKIKQDPSKRYYIKNNKVNVDVSS